MFDRSQIMKEAWKRWRDIRATYAVWQIKRGIVDASFSNCLKIAWRIAKREAVEKLAAAKVFAQYGDRAAERVRELTAELMRLDARPWGMRSHTISSARAAIASEISNLSRII